MNGQKVMNMSCSAVSKDSKHRKILLTINNPTEHGITHDTIKAGIKNLRSTIYYCMADEVSASGTPHIHLFLAFRSPTRWSTIQRQFPTSHLDVVVGNADQVRAYVSKTGKWENSEKKETSVEGTFEEWGELPDEHPGRRSDLEYLYQLISEGADDNSILSENANYIRQINAFDKIRLAIAKESATSEYTPVAVTYIYGDHGGGKTRFVLDNFDSVFRSTAKKNIFDNYSGQSVLFMDSYFNTVPLDELLLYTEGFRAELTCRYCNKYSNWSHVIIASTKPLTDQYKDDQYNNADAWKAFLRRVTTIIHFLPTGEKVYYKVDDDYNIVPVDADYATPDFPSGSSTS